MRKKALLDRFVRLGSRPTMRRINRFANTWGWLGEFRPVVDLSGGGLGLWAEPLSFWRREVLEFRALYETWDALQVLESEDAYGPQRVRAAQRLLEDRVLWHKDGRSVDYHVKITFDDVLREGCGVAPSLEHFSVIASDDIDTVVFSGFPPGELIQPARYYVHREANKRLRGHINLAVLPYLRGRMRLFPDSLLAAIYLHFARELAGAQAEERECKNPRCPTGTFLPRRRDQLYCSKNCREVAGYHRRNDKRKNGGSHNEQAC